MSHRRLAGIIAVLLTTPVLSAGPPQCACATGAPASPRGGACVSGTVSTQKPWAPRRGEPAEPKPVANVRVTITGPIARTTTTGPDGRFSFESLPPGEYEVEGALPDGRGVSEKRQRFVRLDGPHVCAVRDLLAPSQASITGIVMYEDGTAAADVPVELVAANPIPDDQFLGVGGKTNEFGEYTIANVPPGHYLVGVGAIGGPSREEPFALVYGRSDVGDAVIEVSEKDEAIVLAPIVTRHLVPARITGGVQWPDGTPAAGLVITAAPIGERGPVRGLVRTQSAAGGRFTLDVFADTRYRLNVSHGGRIVHSVEMTAAGAPLLITPVR